MVLTVALVVAVMLTVAHRVLAVQHLHQVKETLAVMVFKQVGGQLVAVAELEQQELADQQVQLAPVHLAVMVATVYLIPFQDHLLLMAAAVVVAILQQAAVELLVQVAVVLVVGKVVAA
jgi:hypothetical protein